MMMNMLIIIMMMFTTNMMLIKVMNRKRRRMRTQSRTAEDNEDYDSIAMMIKRKGRRGKDE